MSGHSKWATIKRKKAALDAKRGKEFTKLIKEITVIARLGGGEPGANPRLRLLLEKAKEINMPHDNIVRAIKRGTGEMPGMSYEEQLYEGYGPRSVAVVVETLTDNKNRTVAELRRLFQEHGGSLAEGGAVSWMFQRMGVIYTKQFYSEDMLLELLLDYDITDLTCDQDYCTIVCDPKQLEKVKQALLSGNIAVEKAELEWVAQNTLSVPEDQAESVYTFLSALEDHDDVQNVYTNLADKE